MGAAIECGAAPPVLQAGGPTFAPPPPPSPDTGAVAGQSGGGAPLTTSAPVTGAAPSATNAPAAVAGASAGAQNLSGGGAASTPGQLSQLAPVLESLVAVLNQLTTLLSPQVSGGGDPSQTSPPSPPSVDQVPPSVDQVPPSVDQTPPDATPPSPPTKPGKHKHRHGGPKQVDSAAKTLSTGYAQPVDGKYKRIGNPHEGTHTLGNWQSDNALDMGVKVGTPIYAVADSKITSSGGSNDDPDGRFNGFHAEMHGGGNAWFYTHMSKLLVKEGDKVQKGQLIGYSGSANGVPHLHIAQRDGDPRDTIGVK